MNAITLKQTVPSPPVTTSDRFVSILVIGVVWLVVRLVAELDGLGWERSFWGIAAMLGAIPVTMGFGISAFAKNKFRCRRFRCLAMWPVLATWLIMFFLSERVEAGKYSNDLGLVIVMGFQVLLLTFLLMAFILKR